MDCYKQHSIFRLRFTASKALEPPSSAHTLTPLLQAGPCQVTSANSRLVASEDHAESNGMVQSSAAECIESRGAWRATSVSRCPPVSNVSQACGREHIIITGPLQSLQSNSDPAAYLPSQGLLSCRRSKAHPVRYPDYPYPDPCSWKRVVQASYSVLISRFRAHCRKWHTVRTAPRSMFSRFSCQISLLELCNKRSMACSCFDYSMLCSTVSHLGLHIWQLSLRTRGSSKPDQFFLCFVVVAEQSPKHTVVTNAA